MRAALEARDLERLRELAYRPFGFCSLELRRAVWLFLLGLSPQEAEDNNWRQQLSELEKNTEDAKVMQADVRRSVYSWDVHTGLRKKTRDRKRVQLSEVMHAILHKHQGHLCYFQGFHDIVLVFLEVGSTPSQAFHMAERLALFQLSDQLCLTFDKGLLPLLGVLFQLLSLLHEKLANALLEAECSELHFAVPWVLTLFAHSLPRLNQVQRIFDCLLCSHPATILYFAVALLIHFQEAILQAPREMPEIAGVIQNLPLQDLDADEWAGLARQLMSRVSPAVLMARLPRQQRANLPRTSPLFHYPHPWMKRLWARQVPSSGEVLKLAPVYVKLPLQAAGAAWDLPWLLGQKGPDLGQVALRILGLSTSSGSRGQAGKHTALVGLILRLLSLGAVVMFARAWVRR